MRCEVQEDDTVQVELRCTDCMTRAAGAAHARGDGGARPQRGRVPRRDRRRLRALGVREHGGARRGPRCRRSSRTSSAPTTSRRRRAGVRAGRARRSPRGRRRSAARERRRGRCARGAPAPRAERLDDLGVELRRRRSGAAPPARPRRGRAGRYGRSAGHRVERVADRHDAGAERDLLAREPVRVARAVEALVARAHEPRHAAERRRGAQDPLADHGVLADEAPAPRRRAGRACEDRVRDRPSCRRRAARRRGAIRSRSSARQAEVGGGRLGQRGDDADVPAQLGLALLQRPAAARRRLWRVTDARRRCPCRVQAPVGDAAAPPSASRGLVRQQRPRRTRLPTSKPAPVLAERLVAARGGAPRTRVLVAVDERAELVAAEAVRRARPSSAADRQRAEARQQRVARRGGRRRMFAPEAGASPPATAGRIVTSSPSLTGVSSPSRKRMSSPPM